MPSQFDTIRYKVKHTDNARVVNTCQAVEFIDMAMLSVSSFAERIKSAMPSITTRCIPPMFVMEQVHTFTDEFQSVLSRERSEVKANDKNREHS